MGKPKRVFHNPFKIINSQPAGEQTVRCGFCQVICLQEVDETWAGRLHQHFQSTLVNVRRRHVLDVGKSLVEGDRWVCCFFWTLVKLLKGEVTWWFETMVWLKVDGDVSNWNYGEMLGLFLSVSTSSCSHKKYWEDEVFVRTFECFKMWFKKIWFETCLHDLDLLCLKAKRLKCQNSTDTV